MAEPELIWRVSPSTRLVWRRWGDEFVVFNVASGQTHYLNGLAARVLQYFQDQAATAEELIDDIRRSIPQGGDLSILDQVRDLLAKFDSLGLIAPQNPCLQDS